MKICLQLLEALATLESKSIAHGDLKPRNFLKDYKGEYNLKPIIWLSLGNA